MVDLKALIPENVDIPEDKAPVEKKSDTVKDIKKEIKSEPAEASSTMIQKAVDAVERMEKANAIAAQFVKRMEELQVENTLGGKTTAGAKEPTKEEISIDSAKKLLEGTGFEDTLF